MHIIKSLGPSRYISIEDGDISTNSGCCFVNVIVTFSVTVPFLREYAITFLCKKKKQIFTRHSGKRTAFRQLIL